MKRFDERLICMLWILLVLILLPVIEIFLFIWAGGVIGIWYVLLIILLSGVFGVVFVREQGREAWYKLQKSLREGRPPGDDILSVICVVVGGFLLLLPGFLTDAVGLLLVMPWTRGPFKALILYFIMKKLAKGKTIVYRHR